MSTGILTNVFINTTGNKLQLADIHFSSKIEQINFRLRSEIEWSEISAKEKLISFSDQIASSYIPGGKNIIDGNFSLAVPGGIDPHIHFNTPGFENRDDFEHGSYAAICGGTTTVIDMPCTSLPPVTSASSFDLKAETVRKRSFVDYAFWGGIRGNDFDEGQNVKQQIIGLAQKGAAGYKAYLISGMETFCDLTEQQMMECAGYVRSTGKILAVHAEDKHMVTHRAYEFQKEGKNTWKDYCEARDDKAEAMAVLLMIEIARKTKCRIHIVHLSSKLALQHIRKAKEEGLPVTAETCPHYLYFTQQDFENPAISGYLKTAPPVKSAEDRMALWDALKDGVIDFVSTDHAGCDPLKEKSSSNFWEVYGGIPGVEHRVPFLFSEGFLSEKLTLEQTINLLSANPSRIFHINNKGILARDKDADIALLDLWRGFEVKSSDMHSKGKYTPFEGSHMNCSVKETLLRGKTMKIGTNISREFVGYGELLNIFG